MLGENHMSFVSNHSVKVFMLMKGVPKASSKGRARMLSKDSVIARPCHATPRVSRRDLSRDDDQPQRSRLTAPPREEQRADKVSPKATSTLNT
jgi:hypothetical protein